MNNFKLIHTYINSEEKFNIYKHKSGLEVIFVDTNDDNYTFCAQFKTLPEDDNGIPHILEHIALCGSEKYPIDDPFNELVKGTLFTYLNAITYCDKTIYPVASRNKKEFEKMYKVYLDAIFKPILSEEAFLKEGVRQTVTGYSGIVFNEMSSVYNDVESIIGYETNKLLFQGTPYCYDSGGNPEFIKNATHEQVTEFYKKNYDISKATLYFYGNLDINEVFEYLEKNYLIDFELETKQKDNFVLKKGHKESVIELEKELDIYYYNVAFSFDKEKDNKFFFDELGIAFDYLLESDTSILTSFLKKTYNLIDISYEFDSETRYPYLSITLKSENKVDKIDNIVGEIKKFLKVEIEKGFDHEELKALVSLTNFKYIEENFGYKSKGLAYYLDILNYFNYTDDRKYIHLSKNLDFEDLLKRIDQNYFEKIIFDEVVHCENDVFIEAREKSNYKIEEKRESEFYECESILPFSDEYIKPINISEISDFEELEFENIRYKNREVYFTNNENKEITFLTLAFAIDDNIKDVGIFLELIGNTKTKLYSRKKLKMVCDNYIGDLNISFECIKNDDYENYIIFEVKFLTKYIDEAFEILSDIINNSDYSDCDFNRSKIDELILDFNEELVSDNIRTGIIYSYKDINKKYFNKNIVDGFEFFNTLKSYKEHEKYDFSELNNFLNTQKDVKVFLSCCDKEHSLKSVEKFLDSINIEYVNKNFDEIILEKSVNHIKVETNTYTNVLVGKAHNSLYSGIEEVFCSIIKNEYFNNEIRIKGGAYGYDIAFDYESYFHMYSIDDPNSTRTIEIFREINKFLQEKDFSEYDINKHIIGSVNSFDNFKQDYDKYYLFVLSQLRGLKKGFFVETKRNIVCANEKKVKEFGNSICENFHGNNFLTIGK